MLAVFPFEDSVLPGSNLGHPTLLCAGQSSTTGEPCKAVFIDTQKTNIAVSRLLKDRRHHQPHSDHQTRTSWTTSCIRRTSSHQCPPLAKNAKTNFWGKLAKLWEAPPGVICIHKWIRSHLVVAGQSVWFRVPRIMQRKMSPNTPETHSLWERRPQANSGEKTKWKRGARPMLELERDKNGNLQWLHLPGPREVHKRRLINQKLWTPLYKTGFQVLFYI